MNALTPHLKAHAAVIEPVDSPELAQIASRIRDRLKLTFDAIVATGRDLMHAKEIHGHGNFMAWVKAETGLSQSAAHNYMRVAGRLADKFPTNVNLSPSALYALAAPSTSISLCSDIVEAVNTGAMKSESVIQRIALERKVKRNEAPAPKTKTKAQVKSERDAEYREQMDASMAVANLLLDAYQSDPKNVRRLLKTMTAAGVLKSLKELATINAAIRDAAKSGEEGVLFIRTRRP